MDALVIFAKYPEPGKVKKKIGQVIGMENSARLCAAFIKDLITKNSDTDYDVYLSFIGKENKTAYRSMYPNAILYLQRGYDLGENMYCTFEDLLDDYNKVIIISSDVPNLSSEIIVKAFNALDEYDAAIGPSTDGGYYLLGLKKPAKIFDSLLWGTQTLLDEQLKRINEKHLTYVLMDTKLDVDTIEELREIKSCLKQEDAPETYKIIHELKI
jgi:rSAM/selenodomain-associated transferase 1